MILLGVVCLVAVLGKLALAKAGLQLARGDVVVITGAGSGMGRQLAQDLATTEADLVLVDLKLDAAEDTRSLIQQLHSADQTGELWCVQCPV